MPLVEHILFNVKSISNVKFDFKILYIEVIFLLLFTFTFDYILLYLH